MPPPALYPTQLAPHPGRGDLMAFRDGVFGRRPQDPFGQQQSAFQNGVLGPALGVGEVTPALDDGGPLRSYRDGIFNFPRQIEQQPHPVVSYQDGIFGGASLGLGAETPNDIPNGNVDPAATANAVTTGNGAPAPNGAPRVSGLDMTDPATVREVRSYLALLASSVGVETPDYSDDKTEWDAQSSKLLLRVLNTIGAAHPEAVPGVIDDATVEIGGLHYPTGVFFVLSATQVSLVWAPDTYPNLDRYFTGCLGNLFLQTPPPQNAPEFKSFADQYCPINYPGGGISRAMMYGGAAVAVGLVWLVLRR